MKTILYTGARSGIAKSVIDKLIGNVNYKIYLTVETDAQLKEIAKIYKDIDNVKYFKLDVTSEKDIKTLEKIDIDVLVSNAAVGYGGSVAEMDVNRIKENFDINVFQNIKIIQIVLKQMLKRKKGKIIMMASLAGIIPIPFLGSYCATKASLIKLTECLRLELKYLDNNIDIILIEPGLYHTGFNQVMLENKYNESDKSYFKEELSLIRRNENILTLLEKQSLNSISNKIYKAIVSDTPKFVYRAPISQVIVAKIYQILF